MYIFPVFEFKYMFLKSKDNKLRLLPAILNIAQISNKFDKFVGFQCGILLIV